MKELKNIITTTYEYEDFYIDIVVNGNIIEAYLYHKNYGVKSLMFGSDMKSNNETYDDFVKLVEKNLETQSYIADYMNEYGD